MSRRELVAILDAPVTIHPDKRPATVPCAVLPEDRGKPPPVGPVLVAPSSGLALLGIAVLAVERTPTGYIAVLGSAGTYSPRVSPGDVIGCLV